VTVGTHCHGQRETEREVIRIKATPAAFVGTVHEPDKASALKTAIKQFNIRREDQSRLIVQPRRTDAKARPS
jgi:1,2-phenylacetyl-CoA epoxidase PaaB subunit